MTDHWIDVATFPPYRTGLAATILCNCGNLSTELPQVHLQDPHEPLRAAYALHLDDVGVVRSKGRHAGYDRAPSPWKRMGIK